MTYQGSPATKISSSDRPINEWEASMYFEVAGQDAPDGMMLSELSNYMATH
jgi:hypothetical protein